jgi:hypothetical protein
VIAEGKPAMTTISQPRRPTVDLDDEPHPGLPERRHVEYTAATA